MNHHGLGTYPMYHTEKILERKFFNSTEQVEYEKRHVTMCHDKEIELEDTIIYKHHNDLTFEVSEILEKRKPKGNHKDGVLFYNLILEFKK